MKAEKLLVIIPYSNPIRWQSRRHNFERTIKHLSRGGAELVVVECVHGERDYELQGRSEFQHIGVRTWSTIWNKETLIKIGIERNTHAKFIAWCDGDIIFKNDSWASETLHALQHYEIVQMWDDAIDWGPQGQVYTTHRSFMRIWMHGEPVVENGGKWKKDGGEYEYPHPGYAWACRRSFLENCGGLFELGASGSGDHHMALALVGRVDQSVHSKVMQNCPNFIRALRIWQDRAQHAVYGNMGYVRQTIEHFWHGSKPDRRYWDRWSIFADAKFDPYVDLKFNTWGCIELAGNKPEFRRQIDMYFRARNEDSNVLTG